MVYTNDACHYITCPICANRIYISRDAYRDALNIALCDYCHEVVYYNEENVTYDSSVGDCPDNLTDTLHKGGARLE